MRFLIFIAFLFCSLISYAQVEDTPLFAGKVFMSQTGSGAGYWEVTGTFQDQSGYYDASGITVGYVLFFTDAGVGYHLPITVVTSVTDPSFVIRVNKTGITGIVSVPTGEGVIYQPSTHNLVPYTSGITDPNQQTLFQYNIQKIEEALSTGGATNLSIANITSTTLDVLSSTGTDVTLPQATTSNAGLLSATDKTKLDGLPNSASLTISAGTGTENLAGQTLNVTSSGIATVNYVPASNTLFIGATEVDGDPSNEGFLSLGAATGNTTDLISSTSGSPAIRFAGSGITWSESGNTITATAIDASASNELQDITVASNVIGLTGGVGTTVTIAGAGINSVSTVGSTITITGTEVDGLLNNEGLIGVGAGGANTSVISTNTTGGTGVTISGSTSISISETTSANGGTINIAVPLNSGQILIGNGSNIATPTTPSGDATISNTGVITVDRIDGVQVVATGATTNQVLKFNGTSWVPSTDDTGGGAGATNLAIANRTTTTLDVTSDTGTDVTIPAATTSLAGLLTSADKTKLDGLPNSASVTVSDGTNSENLAGQTLTFVGNGIATVSYNTVSNSLVINAVESDGDITNEGSLSVGAGTGTNSIINSNTSGSTGVTIQGTTGILVSESGNTITLTAADNSNANELQTITSASDATSHTVTLSNAGGSLKLVEGSNITLTTSGTSGDGIVTIASTASGVTDLTVTGTSSPLTLNSSTGTDVTLTAGTGISFTGTSSSITVTNAGDLSATNELQTISTASNTVTLSNSGGSFTIAGGGINTVGTVGSTITVTGTEVDGSITNENLTLTDGTNSENLGGQTLTVTGSGGAVVSYNPATNTLTINAGSSSGGDNWGSQVVQIGSGLTGNGTAGSPLAASDISPNNEGALTVGVGTSTSSIIASNTSGSTNVTLNVGTGLSISETGNDITLTNTAPDQTVALSGTGITVGGTYPSFTLTAADQSNANEGSLTVGAGTTTTSIINSNTTGSTGVTLTAGTGLSISEVGNVITMTNSSPDQTVSISGTGITVGGTYPSFTLTAADQSATNEAQTLSAGGTTSPTISLNQISGTGGGTVTFASSGIASLSQSGGTITVNATEVDGSTTNELQTIANTSDATTHTTTLSNSGGSLQLVEGSGITLTTSGTGLNGIVTIASTSTGTTDLTISGTTSPLTLNSSTGTDVTVTAGTGVSLTGTSGNMTITNTGDISNTNELQTFAHSGTTSYTNTLSNGGGSFTLQSSGIVTISNTSGTVTIGAIEADGSTTNELQTLSTATNTVTLSNSGGSFTIAGSGTNSVSTTGSTITIAGNGLPTSLANSNIWVGNVSNVATAVNPSGDADISNTGNITVDRIDGTNVTATGATANQLMRWNNTTSTWEPSNEKEQSLNVVGTTSPQLELTGNDGVSGSAGSIIVNGLRGITVSNNSGDIDIALPAVGAATNVLTSDGTGWFSQTNPTQTISVSPSSGLNPNLSLTNNAGTAGGGGTVQMIGVSPLEVVATGSGSMNVRISTTGASAGQVLKFDGLGWGFGTDNSGSGATDLTFSGASSPYTLNSSSGTDVTFTNGPGILITRTSNDLQIEANDISNSNEGSLTVGAGTSTTSIINSNTPSSTGVTLTASTGLSIAEAGNVITLTNSAPDQTVSITGAGISAVTGTYPSFTVTSTEVDGLTTNEGTLGVGAGSSTSSTLLTNTSGGNAVTINATSGINITESTSSNGGSISLSFAYLLREENFTSTAGQTAFTIAFTPSAVSGTAIPIRVFRNGVKLDWVASGPTGTQFTYSGTTVTTASNNVGDIIRVEYLN